MTTPLDEAFQLLGTFHEETLELVDHAANIEDREFSEAVAQIREAVTAAGNRVARLLAGAGVISR